MVDHTFAHELRRASKMEDSNSVERAPAILVGWFRDAAEWVIKPNSWLAERDGALSPYCFTNTRKFQ